MLETLDYTICIGSTPTFLYFDLYLYCAYAAHYVYIYVLVFHFYYLPPFKRIFFIKIWLHRFIITIWCRGRCWTIVFKKLFLCPLATLSLSPFAARLVSITINIVTFTFIVTDISSTDITSMINMFCSNMIYIKDYSVKWLEC